MTEIPYKAALVLLLWAGNAAYPLISIGEIVHFSVSKLPFYSFHLAKLIFTTSDELLLAVAISSIRKKKKTTVVLLDISTSLFCLDLDTSSFHLYKKSNFVEF